MYQIILIIHVVIAVAIIALVLVQQGKGATMGAAFGSGASQTVFGSQGSGGFLFKLTGGLAIAFFITSIALTRIAADIRNANESHSLLGLQQATKPAISQPVKQPATSKADDISSQLPAEQTSQQQNNNQPSQP